MWMLCPLTPHSSRAGFPWNPPPPPPITISSTGQTAQTPGTGHGLALCRMDPSGLSPPYPHLGEALLTHPAAGFQKIDRCSLIFQTSTHLLNFIEIGLQGLAYQWEEPDRRTEWASTIALLPLQTRFLKSTSWNDDTRISSDNTGH